MSNEWGGAVILAILVFSAILGANLPAPGGEPSTEQLMAEIMRRVEAHK